MSFSILMASWGTLGNLSPLLTAARRLTERGHTIRVMADRIMQPSVEAAGFTYVSWTRAPTGADADPSDFSDLQLWATRAIFSPAFAYASDIANEIVRVPTDVFITIDLLFGAAIGAEAAGVPVALLSPHVSVRPLPCLPPSGSGLMPPKTEEERKIVSEISAKLTKFADAFLPDLNMVRAYFRLDPLHSVWELFDRSERCFLAISESFDFKAERLPRNYRYVGPLLDEPVWSTPWQPPWPKFGSRPRILLSYSTEEQGQKRLMQKALNAIGLLHVDAVATTGPNLNPTELKAPNNTTLLESAPHNAVMQEVTAVVNQGGHGTVSRCLLYGLPQVILYHQRDQADNAARIHARGAGLRLTSEASETEIAAAINWVLTEPKFRAAAQSLGAEIRHDIADDKLCREVEAMAIRYRAFAGSRAERSIAIS